MAYLEAYRAEDSRPISIDTKSVTGWWMTMDNVTTVRFDGMDVEIQMAFEDVSVKLQPRRPSMKRDPSFNNKTDESHFNELWKQYPRGEGKAAAVRAWCRTAHCRPALPVMLEAIELGKRTEQWQDLSKIPHCSTWLNNRRWEDQVIARNGKSTPSMHDVLEELDSVRSTFQLVPSGDSV